MDAVFVDLSGKKKNFLYQYDKGQILMVEGLNYSTTPEVHFATSAFNAAIIATGVLYSDGVLQAKIPDALLFDARTIFAYIYAKSGSKGETCECVQINVRPRKKPDNYIYSDSMYIIGAGSVKKAVGEYIKANYNTVVADMVINYTDVVLTDDATKKKYKLGVDNSGHLYLKEV